MIQFNNVPAIYKTDPSAFGKLVQMFTGGSVLPLLRFAPTEESIMLIAAEDENLGVKQDIAMTNTEDDINPAAVSSPNMTSITKPEDLLYKEIENASEKPEEKHEDEEKTVLCFCMLSSQQSVEKAMAGMDGLQVRNGKTL